MNKSIILTVVGFFATVVVIGAISFFVWHNQPSADIPTPPVPPAPEDSVIPNNEKPPVPPEPRLLGDSNDSGLVDILDFNAEIVYWKKYMPDFNIVDELGNASNKGIVDALDLNTTIEYWKCFEGNEKKPCLYNYDKVSS